MKQGEDLFFLDLFLGDGGCYCDFDDGQSYYCDEKKSYCNGCCDDFEDKRKKNEEYDLLM